LLHCGFRNAAMLVHKRYSPYQQTLTQRVRQPQAVQTRRGARQLSP